MMGPDDRLRDLPSVDVVLEALGRRGPLELNAVRAAIDAARSEIRHGAPASSLDDIVARVGAALAELERDLLRPVINATGVLLHTNLGRAPLGARQIEAVVAVACGYSNVEYDLVAGTRGSRYRHATRLLSALTGADDALVVNNNAAAVLVVLAALAGGRDVVVSRGELIEIGGEFRIPEIVAAAGVNLVEVGTTNRTRIGDYERAIGPSTAALLKVHPSNYRVVGFTASVAARDLARLARGRGVAFIHDLGSGLIDPMSAPWATDPVVRDAVAESADVVTFSGDKLLGGPQAGVIVGRSECIGKIARHPLVRALRVDKMTLAALQETLRAYLYGDPQTLPLWELAAAPVDELRARAEALAAALAPTTAKVEAVPTIAVAGGGSVPGSEIDSWGVAIDPGAGSPDEFAAALRGGDPPVVARLHDDRVLIDLRSVPRAQDEELTRALVAVSS